jgi:dTDP-4-dehydrorhamnose 3,5-epimerase
MKIVLTEIPDVLIMELQVFQDERGFFYESYNQKTFTEKTGISICFVQDNHSYSKHHVLRG